MSVDDIVRDLDAFAKNLENMSLTAARQMAVDSTTMAIELLDNQLNTLQEVRDVVAKAREISKVADLETLLTITTTIATLMETLAVMLAAGSRPAS